MNISFIFIAHFYSEQVSLGAYLLLLLLFSSSWYTATPAVCLSLTNKMSIVIGKGVLLLWACWAVSDGAEKHVAPMKEKYLIMGASARLV